MVRGSLVKWVRKKRLKTIENVRKRLKSCVKRSKTCVKRLKIFEKLGEIFDDSAQTPQGLAGLDELIGKTLISIRERPN